MSEDAKPNKPDLSALRIEDKARGGGGSKVVRNLSILVVISAVLSGSAIAFFNRRPDVEIAAVRTARFGGPSALLNASGYVTPRRRATIAAKVTARIVEMPVEEGMVVEVDQLLAKLDNTDAKKRWIAARTARDVAAAGVKDLEVTLAGAERDLKRQQQLLKNGVATEQAYDSASTATESLKARLLMAHEQVRAAEADIAIAKLDLDNAEVRAPFPGVVVSKDAQIGEMVSPISAGGFTRTGIATIVDMSSLEIEVDVNESHIAEVKPAQPVEATLEAYPEWKIPAKVRTIIPTADRQKATVKVRIAFNALDPRILPDMGVKVSFLDEKRQNESVSIRTVVPKEALRKDNGKQVVFVFSDGRLERRAVTVGKTREGEVEIVAGLEEGEKVVTNGPATLQDGAKVRVKQGEAAD